MIEVYYVEDDEFIGNTVKEYLEKSKLSCLDLYNSGSGQAGAYETCAI